MSGLNPASILGVFGGGSAQVDAAALTAKTAQVSGEIRSTLLQKFQALGTKIGPTVGGDFFTALANGANASAADARAAESQKVFGFTPAQVKSYAMFGGLLIIGLVVGFFYYRRRKG